MNSHDWRFNELSMGSGPFKPDALKFNLLLVGDSVVLGGNPLTESERLGPQLQKLTNWQVWPISAGSWALQNELSYVRSHSGILPKIDAIAFVLNSGDFDEPSSWASELTHPRTRPFPGLIFLVEKYALNTAPPAVPAALKVAHRDWRTDFRAVSAAFAKPVFVFLYPDQSEVRDPQRMQRLLMTHASEIKEATRGTARVYNVARQEWTLDNYRDGIHPSGKGNMTLAAIFKTDICRTPEPKMTCK
jgi:lysophospholipase L1-like esterase